MSGMERALTFRCGDETLVGILAMHEERCRDTALLVVVGGPQYRVGSHRQFVLLARRAAAEGYPTLRFDYRGMGDSSGAMRGFESVCDDIGAAIDALMAACPSVRRILLWGLCDGASASLLYLEETADPRIAGLCLLNPWVRSPASLARTHVRHYYLQRLQQADFWHKLLTGRVAGQALHGLLANLRLAGRRHDDAPARPFQERMGLAWDAFGGSTLLVLSGDDYTAKEFLEHACTDPAWRARLTRRGVERHDVAGADHTFSGAAAQRVVESVTLDWMCRLWPGHVPEAASRLESADECS